MSLHKLKKNVEKQPRRLPFKFDVIYDDQIQLMQTKTEMLQYVKELVHEGVKEIKIIRL